MTERFVGKGGDNGNSGLSWALRKLTLNGAEDTPVVAGDTVHVGPGVYREGVTADVHGTSDNRITYIADIFGVKTDGIGGIVRVTGSDNDTSATRSSCITAYRNYRTFRGFSLDTTTGNLISTSGNYGIVEDCYFQGADDASAVYCSGSTQSNFIFRRNFVWFLGAQEYHGGCFFTHTSDVSNVGHTVSNNIFIGGFPGVLFQNIGGVTTKNNIFLGNNYGGRQLDAPASGQKNNFYNNQFLYCTYGLLGKLSENFIQSGNNNYYQNGTDKGNWVWGLGGDTTNAVLFEPGLMQDNLETPWFPFKLSEWSDQAAKSGTATPTGDFYGIDRPTTVSKKSWGPIQYVPQTRAISPVKSLPSSLEISDAGIVRFIDPNVEEETTVAVWVQREADYAGTLPQLRVVSDGGTTTSTDTDTGSASQWNQLSLTSGGSGWTGNFLQIELVSNNTATSGSYAVYFDDLQITPGVLADSYGNVLVEDD